MTSTEQLLKEAKAELAKIRLYFETYGTGPSGICPECDEFTHELNICEHCGFDNHEVANDNVKEV